MRRLETKHGAPPKSSSITRKTTYGATLALAALVALGVGRVFRTDAEYIDHANENPPAAVDTLDPSSRKKFDVATYTPPKEGVVIKKYVSGRPNAKTIIYLPDIHFLTGMTVDQTDRQRMAQREIYRTGVDLIEKYGQIALVLEGMPIGWGYAQMEEMAKLLNSGEITDPGETDPTYRPMAKLFQYRPDKKETLADKMMGKEILPASIALGVVFKDKVAMIGTIAINDSGEIVDETDPQVSIYDFNRLAWILDSHADGFLCGDKKSRRRISLAAARASFKKGNRSNTVVDCYCAFQRTSVMLADRITYRRSVMAPAVEVRQALDYQGSGLVVINAGLNHLSESLRLLEAAGANYIVVAPASMEEDCRRGLTGLVSKLPILPDDDKGTCEKWEAARVRRQIQDLLRDDDE